MGLWKSIFGGADNMSEEERREQARAGIVQVQEICLADPKKALKSLRKLGKQFHDLLRLQGELHGEFRKAAAEAWSRTETAWAGAELPSVKVVLWSTWPEPKIRDVRALAEQVDEEVINLAAPPDRSHRDALAELEGLTVLARDKQVAFVAVGEEDLIARRSFLLEACSSINPDYEEIIQDLSDFARDHGWKTGTVVA